MRLFADPSATLPLTERPAGPLSAAGTDVAFPEVTARVVQVTLDEVAGHIDGAPAAGLAEVEVEAKGADRPPPRTTVRR